jgi:hypothetical protein
MQAKVIGLAMHIAHEQYLVYPRKISESFKVSIEYTDIEQKYEIFKAPTAYNTEKGISGRKEQFPES